MFFHWHFFILVLNKKHPWLSPGSIAAGLPTLQPPQFGISATGNETELATDGEEYASLPTMMSRFNLYSALHCSLVQSCIATFSRLGLSLIIVPVVAIIDAAAIAKAFGENHIAVDHGHNHDDQCNVNVTIPDICHFFYTGKIFGE